MIFRDKCGKMRLAFHSPNSTADGEFEHLTIKELEERDGTLVIKEE
jgi:hypothetical protein